jgi:hypothetical protein
MADLLDEIHPGAILLKDFMKPLGISARQLAGDIDASPSRISEAANGNRPITADTALRLGLFFKYGASVLDEFADLIRHSDRRTQVERKNYIQDSCISAG